MNYVITNGRPMTRTNIKQLNICILLLNKFNNHTKVFLIHFYTINYKIYNQTKSAEIKYRKHKLIYNGKYVIKFKHYSDINQAKFIIFILAS